MQKLIIILCLLICFDVYALKLLREQERQIDNNYYGINLIYNMAQLIEPETSGTGLGFDLYYQSFLSKSFSYKILGEFLYNSFSNDFQDVFYNPLISGDQTLKYSREDNFIHLAFGILFNYSFDFNSFYPYISSGLMYSFIHKSYIYNYSTKPIDFIETEQQAIWLPAALTVPVSLGVNFYIDGKNFINLNGTWLLMNYDDINKKYGYNNIINIKLGYMRKIDFKL